MSQASDLLKTPLYDLHVRAGGRLVPFAGYSLPSQYATGVIEETLHTRKAAGLFDVSHMGRIDLTPNSGKIADAALALETIVPSDILGLKQGRQRYSVLTNERGGIRDDLMIANLGDRLMLIVNAACKQSDLEHNHGGLMTKSQMAQWQTDMGVPRGQEWEPFAAVENVEALKAFLAGVPFFSEGVRRHIAPKLPVPSIQFRPRRNISTQAAFGNILDELAKGDSEFAKRILTTSPDVTGTTGLGAFVNRRNLFARDNKDDAFIEHRIPSTAKWNFMPEGQHFELGIAEMNLFLLLGAAGLSHSLWGKRLIPIGTVYDPFVHRGLDALNYACYQDARFLIVGTPSGVSLAPEGGAHQSIGTPLSGMAQNGLSSFEPAFADELALIMEWAFDYMQREGRADPDERTLLCDEAGGAVYLRLTTKPLEQPNRQTSATLREGVIAGAYWLRPPGPNCSIVIAYQGAVADEAIAAAGLIGEYRCDIGVLAVTSADRLHAGWTAAQRERARGDASARSHIEKLISSLPSYCTLVTVLDGHPATLSWLGGVAGHRLIPLGVGGFGQSGSIGDLARHFRIDRHAIVGSINALTSGRPC
ncbi:hypothetical protein [Erythrobacter sp. AP23]|uniref:hypothetical protein n=1 Tax=Erythrobacter sp. AP23 TaxID=499656 RepID=UPI0009F8CB03|nr:hypothetical protein [Erythrobacter sp. AP23]